MHQIKTQNDMNKVFESPTTIVHDDRTPLTFTEAFEILWAGQAIYICYPPDYGEEEEHLIFDQEVKIYLTDTDEAEKFLGNKEAARSQAYDYLRGYELYK